MTYETLIRTVRHNCDISDARDNGIYSICTLVLKLRNLYKWEHGLEPWDEPESRVLLDWIAAKEEYWERLQPQPFSPIRINGEDFDPFLLKPVNNLLAGDRHHYGAGYGRSMKAVFFLAEISENRLVEGIPTLILGREQARELSSPFAMLQDDTIYIRKEPLRFFFWDQIQEINPSCRVAMRQALGSYDLLRDNINLDRKRLIGSFDDIVDRELDIFIYHEVGERQENPLNSRILKTIINTFPASPLELLARAVKDILADTHPRGLLSHIVKSERRSSLGFYISFLDGMRRHLCPELNEAGKCFWDTGDWSLLEEARAVCRKNNAAIAARFEKLGQRLADGDSPATVKRWAAKTILAPLGIQIPEEENSN